MLDMLWCGEHEEDRSARFINDRVHANIQKDGTFSVVPRMRGGVTSPAELRRIADVAEKYNVPHGQGHGQPAHRSAGSQESGSAEGVGRPRNAFRPGLHQGRAHGEDLRGHRVLPLRRAGFDQRRNRTGAAPGKSVHAAQGEDGRGGLPAQLCRSHGEGYRHGRAGGKLAGGGGRSGRQIGSQGRPADHGRDHRSRRWKPASCSSSTTARTRITWSALTISSSGWESKRSARRPCTRRSRERHKLLDRLQRSKALAKDAWLERDAPAHPTQFVQIEPIEIKPVETTRV